METDDISDRAEGRPESIKHSLEDADDEADSMEEQKEPDAFMKHVTVIPRVVLQAFMDESLTAGWTREQVV